MAVKTQTGPVTIEIRKFLGAINSSLQAKTAAMEGRVRELGQQAGVNWRLASLGVDNLFIEDIDSHLYYGASYRREKGGNVVIENVRPLRIVESKKRTLFEANCKQLIDALEMNDQRGINAAFSKMAGQRFSSRTVPQSGLVRTHDNVTRSIALASESVVDNNIRPRLVAAIVDGLTNKVIIREGVPVRGTFVDRKLRLPVNEWLTRKAVARQIRRIAEDAYWSTGFQNRISDVAKLIYEDKVEDAVKLVSAFLAEDQEFTTLNREQTKRLIENALAARACFNQKLCSDTATLFWRTNLKVNRDSIIKEWRVTAKKAAHTTLLENVAILEQSPNFEAAYDKFINLVFNEAVGPKDVQVDAYKTALQVLKDTPKIKESTELAGKIDELIERLDQPETDHAVIAEVEDLLAEVKNEMNALESLSNFDQVPGGAGGVDDAAEALGSGSDPAALGGDAASGKKGGTTVNFNISINGDGVEADGLGGEEEAGGEEEGGDEDLEALLGGGEEEAGGEEEGGDDLAALLGGGEEEAGGEEEGGDDLAALLKGESRGRERRPITEVDSTNCKHEDTIVRDGVRQCSWCGKKINGGDKRVAEDDGDPYSYASKTKVLAGLGADYGTNPIEISEDCYRAVTTMLKIAEHNELSGGALFERAEDLAKASIKATGLIIPERRADQAVEQLCDAFFDELDRQGVELDEDQFKGPWRHVWSRKKAAINRRESKKGTRSEGRQFRPAVTESCIDDQGVDQCQPGTDDQPASKIKGKQWEKPWEKKGEQRKRKAPPKVEWVEEQTDAKKGVFGGVSFIFDHANGAAAPVILSEDGQVEVPIPVQLRESAYAAADMAQGDSRPFLNWLIQNLEQFRPISETETADLDQSISEATVKIKTNADGGVDIEVDSADPDVNIGDPTDDLDMPEDEIGMGGDPLDDAAPGMAPIDSMITGPDDAGDDMGDGMGGDIAQVADDMGDGPIMPDFEGGAIEPGAGESDDIGADEPGDGDAESDNESESDDKPAKKGPPTGGAKKAKKGPPSSSDDDDDDGVAEDRDITTPQTRKYNTTKDNHRKTVEVPKAKKPDDKLDGFGDGPTDTPGVQMKKVTAKKK